MSEPPAAGRCYLQKFHEAGFVRAQMDYSPKEALRGEEGAVSRETLYAFTISTISAIGLVFMLVS